MSCDWLQIFIGPSMTGTLCAVIKRPVSFGWSDVKFPLAYIPKLCSHYLTFGRKMRVRVPSKFSSIRVCEPSKFSSVRFRDRLHSIPSGPTHPGTASRNTTGYAPPRMASSLRLGSSSYLVDRSAPGNRRFLKSFPSCCFGTCLDPCYRNPPVMCYDCVHTPHQVGIGMRGGSAD